jgi:RimJ/RimL family protein N-acetyltransferase
MTLLESVRSETLREGSIPVLETKRLQMRAPRHGDVKAVATLANDRRIAENTARIPHPYGADDAAQWIASVNAQVNDHAGETAFVITLTDGTLIGACGFGLLREGAPEIGYWLGSAYWGQGYATEAVHAVIDYAFDDCGHDALQAGARVTNPASRRVLEKCGFQWTGVGLYRIRALNSSAPIDRFRLDRGLWSSLKAWGMARRVV